MDVDLGFGVDSFVAGAVVVDDDGGGGGEED
jgi:hypothetical protein